MKKHATLKAAAIVAVLVIAIIVAVFVLRPDGNEPALTDSSATPSSESQSAADESTTQPTQTQSEPLSIENVISTEPTETEPPTSELTTSMNTDSGRIVVDVNREDWNLIVVNAGREMPQGYEPKLEEIFDTGKYLDYRVAPHYEEMYTAAKQEGLDLFPYSAYRSYDRQKTNYENLTRSYMSQYNLSQEEAAKKAATVILPPGTSEHNLGFAMDIQGTESSFANTKEYAWLTEHAHEYGFILRYTAEKQPITGIIPEPWHWRYVGVEHAEKIKNSGLCLEEYLDSIGVAY